MNIENTADWKSPGTNVIRNAAFKVNEILLSVIQHTLLFLRESSTSLYILQILYVTAQVNVESARGPLLKLSFLFVSFSVIVLSRMDCKVISDWGMMLRIMRYFIRENYEKNGEVTDLCNFRWIGGTTW